MTLAMLALLLAAKAGPHAQMQSPPQARADVAQIDQLGAARSAAPVAAAPSLPAPPAVDLQVRGDLDRALIAAPARAPGAVTPPVAQLSSEERSAQGAPALSSTAQSRPAAAEAIGGSDRCDPRAPRAERRAECRAPIETRSAEFERSVPVLSPEQRLLLEQRGVRLITTQSASRRLGTTGEGLTSSEQAVASVALGGGNAPPPPAPPPAPRPEDAPLTPEQAAAIVGAILSQPGK